MQRERDMDLFTEHNVLYWQVWIILERERVGHCFKSYYFSKIDGVSQDCPTSNQPGAMYPAGHTSKDYVLHGSHQDELWVPRLCRFPCSCITQALSPAAAALCTCMSYSLCRYVMHPHGATLTAALLPCTALSLGLGRWGRKQQPEEGGWSWSLLLLLKLEWMSGGLVAEQKPKDCNLNPCGLHTACRLSIEWPWIMYAILRFLSIYTFHCGCTHTQDQTSLHY